MTTTPETPALPGDLTDETIERAARAIYEVEQGNAAGPSWERMCACPPDDCQCEDSEGTKYVYLAFARAALAAARVAPFTPNERTDEKAEQIASLASMLKLIEWQIGSDQGSQWLAGEMFARGARAPQGHQHVTPAPDSGRCGGCRDLGPHRNVPGCDYFEPEPAQVTAASAYQQGWRDGLLKMAEDISGRYTLMDAGGEAWGQYRSLLRRDAEIGPDRNPFDGVVAPVTPSPDREKLVAELREEARIVREMTERDPDGPGFICRWDPDEELLDRAAAALAVPPAVNEAPASVTIAHAQKGGKTSALVDAVLAKANERGIEVTIVPPVIDEAKLAEAVGILSEVTDVYATVISTHYEGCYRAHAGCLSALLRDVLDEGWR